MALNVAWAARPCRDESACGDRCGWWSTSERIVLALADGLGHGPAAAAAADLAMNAIGIGLGDGCEEIFAACDFALRNTRGAALAVAIVDRKRHRLVLAAVGNIRALLLTAGKDLRLGGARGIVGAGYAPLLPETLPLAGGDVLVLYSDGLDEFAAVRDTVANAGPSARQQAEHMLQRWARADDDAAVLVYRHES